MSRIRQFSWGIIYQSVSTESVGDEKAVCYPPYAYPPISQVDSNSHHWSGMLCTESSNTAHSFSLFYFHHSISFCKNVYAYCCWLILLLLLLIILLDLLSFQLFYPSPLSHFFSSSHFSIYFYSYNSFSFSYQRMIIPSYHHIMLSGVKSGLSTFVNIFNIVSVDLVYNS